MLNTSSSDRFASSATSSLFTESNLLPGVSDPLKHSFSTYNTALSTSSATLPEVNLGALSGTRIYSGNINNNNVVDLYHFSVLNAGATGRSVNFTLSGMTTDADLQLIRDSNNNGVLDASDTLLRQSINVNNSAEWISDSLTNGGYFLKVKQYSGNTSYNMTASTGDWFSQNLGDAGVIGEARTHFVDGVFGRGDMIGILRETRDGNQIDATELTDLRRVLTNFRNAMPAHVSNLTGKVINGDPANLRSGIGNLFAGSASSRMDQLIGKWFYGSDRPVANGTYRYASGSLFRNGISASDVNQGSLGNCYLIAAFGALANDRPSTIQNMFIDNQDGTYTVRFFRQGVADYLTVDRYLPVDPTTGRFIYATKDFNGTHTNPNNELWVALAEKAYAQLNESGWTGQETAANSYSAIAGGWPFDPLTQISGASGSSFSANQLTHSQLVALVNSNTPITAGFVNGGGFGVVNEHAYTITGYDPITQRFHLHNPWGHQHANLTLQQLRTLNARIEWCNV